MTEAAHFTDALAAACDQYGRSLAELSEVAPTLVIFLRHFG